MSGYSVALSQLVQEFNLELVNQASDFDRVRVTVEDVNRPALQMVGFYEHFEPARLQMVGMVEFTYLNGLSPEQRFSTFDRFFSYKVPALVFSRGLQPFPECLETARKHDVTVLSSNEATSSLLSAMIAALKGYLAPRITRHGVLVEVYGEGLLLLGDSGVGKSEAAIELVKRGHRLIADDAVEIQQVRRARHRGHRARAHPALYRAARHRRHQRGQALRHGLGQGRLRHRHGHQP